LGLQEEDALVEEDSAIIFFFESTPVVIIMVDGGLDDIFLAFLHLIVIKIIRKEFITNEGELYLETSIFVS
jgi:hypothetical protein